MRILMCSKHYWFKKKKRRRLKTESRWKIFFFGAILKCATSLHGDCMLSARFHDSIIASESEFFAAFELNFALVCSRLTSRKRVLWPISCVLVVFSRQCPYTWQGQQTQVLLIGSVVFAMFSPYYRLFHAGLSCYEESTLFPLILSVSRANTSLFE